MATINTILNVRDFGAKGDGTQAQNSLIVTGTDDSAAFKAAIAFIYNNTKRVSQYNDRAVNYILYVPAGRYIITEPGSLIPPSYTTPAIGGLTIKGDGRGATEIHYKPSTAGTYLCDNQNGFNFLHFQDITFSSTGASDGVLNNTFLRSNSKNQAQNYIFDHCLWTGGWKYIWYLVGINTNSECSWFHCGVSGPVATAFYIPPYNGSNPDVSGSDQMVNYNFYACQFEVSKGNYFRCDQGGAINIWGGSIINTSGGVGDGTNNNTFFKLGLAQVSTNQGAYKLLVQGVRFEMRGSSNTKVIECNWKFGTVTFIGCDMEVHSWVSGVNNQVYAIFDFGSENGAIVQWIGCNFQGKHQYKYSGNGYQRRAQVLYQGCEFWNWNMPEDFIIMTNNSGTTNRASIPVIKFEGCRGMNAGTNQSLYITDTNMNWHLNYRGVGDKKVIRISSPDNQFPRGGGVFEVYLPLNCLITSVSMIVAAGETTSTTTGWHYFVNTSETTPRTLADITPISNNPSLGLNTVVTLSPPFFANTDAKRHLKVSSNASVNADVRGFILIEYIG